MNNQRRYFSIGLFGAFIFIIFFLIVNYVNNMVAPFFPPFIITSVIFLGIFALGTGLTIAILLQETNQKKLKGYKQISVNEVIQNGLDR